MGLILSVGLELSVELTLSLGLTFKQGAQVGTLCWQNDRNFALDRLALTSIFGLCFMPVCIIKSNCYYLIYSSLSCSDSEQKPSHENRHSSRVCW